MGHLSIQRHWLTGVTGASLCGLQSYSKYCCVVCKAVCASMSQYPTPAVAVYCNVRTSMEMASHGDGDILPPTPVTSNVIIPLALLFLWKECTGPLTNSPDLCVQLLCQPIGIARSQPWVAPVNGQKCAHCDKSIRVAMGPQLQRFNTSGYRHRVVIRCQYVTSACGPLKRRQILYGWPDLILCCLGNKKARSHPIMIHDHHLNWVGPFEHFKQLAFHELPYT